MYDYIPIKNYINYLKNECALSVTLHIFENGFKIPMQLVPYNLHDNAYCVYLKNCDEAAHFCRTKQINVLEKCKSGSFEGVCYAGVKELVYPLRYNDETIGFICVSGYKCENHREYIKAVSKKYNLPQNELLMAYNGLKEKIPKKERVDTLIMPLCDMLELFFIKSKMNINEAKENICERFVRYLTLFHSRDITSEDMCAHFSISRSYLSRKFNEYTGMSIRKYITMLRIEDAKELLKNSDLSVTEIAYCVGFRDANYFTLIFKKEVGKTPSEYKRA